MSVITSLSTNGEREREREREMCTNHGLEGNQGEANAGRKRRMKGEREQRGSVKKRCRVTGL